MKIEKARVEEVRLMIPEGRGYQPNYLFAIEVYNYAIVTDNKILEAPAGGIFRHNGPIKWDHHSARHFEG